MECLTVTLLTSHQRRALFHWPCFMGQRSLLLIIVHVSGHGVLSWEHDSCTTRVPGQVALCWCPCSSAAKMCATFVHMLICSQRSSECVNSLFSPDLKWLDDQRAHLLTGGEIDSDGRFFRLAPHLVCLQLIGCVSVLKPHSNSTATHVVSLNLWFCRKRWLLFLRLTLSFVAWLFH